MDKYSGRSLKNIQVKNINTTELIWVMKGEEITVSFLLVIGNKLELPKEFCIDIAAMTKRLSIHIYAQNNVNRQYSESLKITGRVQIT